MGTKRRQHDGQYKFRVAMVRLTTNPTNHPELPPLPARTTPPTNQPQNGERRGVLTTAGLSSAG